MRKYPVGETLIEEAKELYKEKERAIRYNIVHKELNPKYKNSLELLLFETENLDTANLILAYTASLIRYRIVRPSKLTLYKCEVLKDLPQIVYSTKEVATVTSEGMQYFYN